MTDTILPEGDPERHGSFIVTDALETIMNALSGLDFDDPQALEDYDRITALLPGWTPFPEVFQQAGIDARPVTMAAVILLYVLRWTEGGAEHLLFQPELPELSGDQSSALLVTLAFACARALADFEDDDPAERLLDACYRSFAALARHLEDGSWMAASVAAWVTASNFARSADRLLASGDELTRVAGAVGDQPGAALGLARRAQALTFRAETEPECRLAAFDAVMAALRHVHQAGERRDGIRALLDICVSQRFLADLRYPFTAAFCDDDTGTMADLRDTVREIWDLDLADMARAVPVFDELNIHIENARWRLEPVQPDAAIHASWISWSFDHPAHRRAVPHGRSIRIDERYEDLLLELDHEITHIITMIGQLGMVSLALRAAAVELETVLWTFMGQDQQADAASIGIAPLTTTSVVALAQAEQSLEIVRKLQILQATWTPWLEGVAVFGELAADPSELEAATPVADVIVNLDDVEVVGGSPESIMSALLEFRGEADRSYAEVQRQAGRHRLATYLDSYRGKYLAGYLAVRSVVSAWRDATGLTGAEAFGILLSMTRYGTADAIPRLDLPVAEFAVAARESMLAWLDRTAHASQADLTELLARWSEDTGFGWRDGRLFTGRQRDEDLIEVYLGYVVSAMSSLRGADLSPAERVPDADESCRKIMLIVADALTHRSVRPRLAEDLLRLLTDQMVILPLGSTSAPFWLNDRTSQLLCAFRTTEKRTDTGQPSYSLVVTPLDAQDYAALRGQAEAHPGRRMMVHRVADLHFHGPGAPDRGLGRNLLVFQLGEWMGVQPRGLLTNTKDVDPDLITDIRNRLLPPEFVRTERRLAAGEGAARVARWIESVPAWTEGDHGSLPVEAWARHVRGLAGEVERGGSVYESAANHALLRRLFDSDLAMLLQQDGFRGLIQDPADMSRLWTALHSSGASRVRDGWLTGLGADAPVLRILRDTEHGWDVVPISR
jgi:hypothetical protein